MRRKSKTLLTVVVWDLYPAHGTEGEQGVKRCQYQWHPGTAWSAIWCWLFKQHGNTDLRYAVLEGGNVTRQGSFARCY